MANKKGRVSAAQIFGVIAVFVVSIATGYMAPTFFDGLIVSHGKNKLNLKEVAIKKVGSPSYTDGVGYSFTVKLEPVLESSEEIVYCLYAKSDTSKIVYTSNTGSFNSIQPTADGCYYVRAESSDHVQKSRFFTVNGFEAIKPLIDLSELPEPDCHVSLVGENVYNVSIDADIHDDAKDSVVYRLYKSADGQKTLKTDYSSDNGSFSNVRAEKGMKYYYRIELKIADKNRCTGFFEMKDVKWANSMTVTESKPAQEQLTAQEVQDLINARDAMAVIHNNRIRNAKVVITNPNATSENWSSLSGFMQQKMAWESVEVESLDFNKDNTVNAVTMSVNYN